MKHFIGSALVIMLTVLLLGGGAVWVLHHVAKDANRIADSYLPRLILAQQLAVDTFALADITAQIPGATTTAERVTLLDRIEGRTRQIDRHIEALHKAGLQSSRLAALDNIRHALTEGAHGLSNLAASHQAIEQRLHTKAHALQTACAITSSMNDHALCSTAFALLGRSPPPNSILQTIHRQIKEGKISNALAEILSAPNGILKLRQKMDEEERHKHNLLRRQERIADRMVALVTNLADETTKAIDAQQIQSRDLANKLQTAFTIAFVLSVIIAIMIYHQFRRRIIDRLLTLRNAMVGWRASRSLEHPTQNPGGDELEQMGFALKDLLKAIDQRTTELTYLATMDDMTGLCNRRYFLEQGEQEAQRADRYGHPAAFMIIDIDHFKTINDTFGHSIGDKAIIAMGDFMRQCMRETDILARIGGEEFAALLPETTGDQALNIAERLRSYVYSQQIPTGQEDNISYTISIGLTELQTNEEILQTLKRADEALYRAKNNGRNQIRILHPSEKPSPTDKAPALK